MKREPSPQELDDLAAMLDMIAEDIGEDITREDPERHPWLRRIVLAADRIENAVRYDALVWAKERA